MIRLVACLGTLVLCGPPVSLSAVEAENQRLEEDFAVIQSRLRETGE